MKKSILSFLFVVLITGILPAQHSDLSKKYGDQITPSELKDYLSIIASDSMEGRKTGTHGQKMAATFIEEHFREAGLKAPVNNTYRQPVELYSTKVDEVYLRIGTERFDNFGEIVYIGTGDSGGEVPADFIFIGRGTEDDLKQVDIKNRVVVALTSGGPMSSTRALTTSLREKGAKVVVLAPESTPDEFMALVDRMKGFVGGGELSLKKPDGSGRSTFMISKKVAEKLFSVSYDALKAAADNPNKEEIKKIKPGKGIYKVSVKATPVETENILGFLEGTTKKDEVIIIGAHYDHIGMTGTGEDRINNGADDDGSGTVSVLAIAKAFAKAKKDGVGPGRSILFLSVVGEEQGLLGSQHYVEHPLYPLANTVVDLNMDMIGRTDAAHKDNSNYVYVIGSNRLSAELHKLNEDVNAAHNKLAFDYTYNDENHPTNLYKRSDHWNFAKNGIPIIFYFDGIHEDYHRPSDEVSKIDFDLLAKRAQCVFYVAWEIANRDKRIVADPK
jgi:Zn-dependent M28 family amino/carboxypeptidase